MDNAAKALIIAGTCLITVLVISIGIYLIGELRQTSDSYVEKLDNTELQKYNNNFIIYIGRTDISAQEIITVVNIAEQKDQETLVYLDNNQISGKNEEWKNQFLSTNILIYTKDQNTGEETIKNTYSCTEIIYDETGKVSIVKFKKN